MNFGERLKYARNKLGMSRMQFAVLLGMTEGSIANIENCKDGKKKLGYDKMLEVILVAKLPKGWWFYIGFRDGLVAVATMHDKGSMLVGHGKLR